MWYGVKLVVFRWLTRQALKGGWYYRWSRVYRFLFEWRYRKWVDPGYTSLPDGVEATLGRMVWRKDPWWMLYDAVSYPRAVLKRHLSGKAAGDCDEFAIFAVWAIRDMMGRGYLKDFRSVGMLSVPWLDEKGKCGGHNVCVVSYIDRQVGALHWAYMSNWYGGGTRTHGHLNKRPFICVEDVVRDVLGSKASLGWARADCGLNLVEYDSGRSL